MQADGQHAEADYACHIRRSLAVLCNGCGIAAQRFGQRIQRECREVAPLRGERPDRYETGNRLGRNFLLDGNRIGFDRFDIGLFRWRVRLSAFADGTLDCAFAVSDARAGAVPLFAHQAGLSEQAVHLHGVAARPESKAHAQR